MKNYDSHVLLYAKHHYQTGNLWEDLAKILAERNALDPNHITPQLIFENIVHITLDYIKINARQVANLLMDIQPSNWWMFSEKRSINVDISEYDFYKAAVIKCLSLLAITTVYDKVTGETLIEIDDPDPSILPLSEQSIFNKKGG